jgi:serine/threonine protein kinase
MFPTAFNITNFDHSENIETFKNNSDSDSDADPSVDPSVDPKIILDINNDGIKGTIGDNYIVTHKTNNNKTVKKSSNNGHLIGEGTFGCIYDDLKDPTKVHKIFLHSSQYSEELNVAKMLDSSFKKNNIAFPKGLLLPDNIIKPNLPNSIDRNYLTSSGLKICKLLKDKDNKYNKDKYLYLTYTNGGEAINMCLDKFDTVFDLLVALDNIFDAIDKLERVKIAHHDIKMPNVLYDINTHSTILIDYGITYKYTDLFVMNPTNNKNWPNSYFVWPPEFHAIWYIMINKTAPSAIVMRDKVKTVVNIKEDYIPYFTDLYESGKDLSDFTEFRNELVKNLELNESVDREINNIDNDSLSQYFTTNFSIKSDSYGLAILIYAYNKRNNYLEVNGLEKQLAKYLKLASHSELNKSQQTYCLNIRNMMRKMGCANPYNRFSSNESNTMYTKLIRTELFEYKNPKDITAKVVNEINPIKPIIYPLKAISYNLSKLNNSNESFETIEQTIQRTANAGALHTNYFYIFVCVVAVIAVCVIIPIYFGENK